MLGAARMSSVLRAGGQCRQLYTGPVAASLHLRCVHTVSLLDFRPQGWSPGAHARLQHRRPSAWCRAEQHFSTAGFPTEARVVGSPETTSYLRNPRNGSEIYLVGTMLPTRMPLAVSYAGCAGQADKAHVMSRHSTRVEGISG
jgi:hypothetical protein